MTPLSDIISNAVSHSNHFWFPQAASRLADFAWEDARRYDFSPGNYGTHRWLHKDPMRERIRRACFALSDTSELSIEILPNSSRKHFENTGLVFSDQCPVGAFPSALDVIRCVPSLYTTISLYLRSLHLLAAPSDDHDVSHSDPAVPFSIFISVPPLDSQGRIRLAESIVHECMHLQLSIMERIVPLVDEPKAMSFSPWQQTSRPVSGLLHGLYVFTVIHNFLTLAALSGSLGPDERKHVNSRCRKIANEVNQLSSDGWTSSLSTIGRCLARRLLESFVYSADK